MDIDGIDFPALGRAFGGRGERVADLAELPAALKRALDVNGPTVIEVTVDGSGSSAT
ncbi:thiamine pyrophosphate-dependent enzyme [Nonomuraea dietziae]|uniref:thiamine pyrophosphate-dependent enzyme n=1 Tax=Nonomuraea dietziae TaxID=65515 RepID=UPI00337CD025